MTYQVCLCQDVSSGTEHILYLMLYYLSYYLECIHWEKKHYEDRDDKVQTFPTEIRKGNNTI